MAVCTVLVPQGFYEFKGRDDDGWPHFEEKIPLPALEPKEQDRLIRRALVEYFGEDPVRGHRPAKRLSAASSWMMTFLPSRVTHPSDLKSLRARIRLSLAVPTMPARSSRLSWGRCRPP